MIDKLVFTIEEKTKGQDCSWCHESIHGYSFVVYDRYYHHQCYDIYEDMYYKDNCLYDDLNDVDRESWDFYGD